MKNGQRKRNEFFDKKPSYGYTYKEVLCVISYMQKKLLIILWVIMAALYAVSKADIVLNFPNLNIQSFENRFSLVHFMAAGNDFAGSIFRLPSVSTTWTTISLSGGADVKTGCTKQLRGIYFNSQRGKRLWPLDGETLTLLQQANPSYNDLQIEWWLYTTCSNTSSYSIFWAITYTRAGTTKSYIVAGIKYDYQANKINPHFAKSFQYFDNKVPMWYIYDSNGGIGFIGGELSGHEQLIEYLSGGGSINSGFTYSGDLIVSNNPWREANISGTNSAMETMRNIIIQGSVGLSKSMEAKERVALLGNLQTKTVIYNGSDINSSTLINFAKQRAQELCQGQAMNPVLANAETIACYDNDITIDLASNEYANKTIVVKNANVTLIGGMNSISAPLDLFIDKWLLYLPTDPITRETFTEEWFPGTPSMTSGLFLKGNFIINGLMIGSPDFMHKLHIQGKLTTLNTPVEPNQWRIDQITNMFGWTVYNNAINLQNVFTRTCGLSGTAISDQTPCGGENIISSTPLVILNGNYPSNLLQ